MTGSIILSTPSLEEKLSSAPPVEDSIERPIEILSEEQLKKSGLKSARMMFNNYLEGLKSLAENIYLGTNGQVDIKVLPEYEKLVLAVAELKKAGMKDISSKFVPEVNVYYHPKDGQIHNSD